MNLCFLDLSFLSLHLFCVVVVVVGVLVIVVVGRHRRRRYVVVVVVLTKQRDGGSDDNDRDERQADRRVGEFLGIHLNRSYIYRHLFFDTVQNVCP